MIRNKYKSNTGMSMWSMPVMCDGFQIGIAVIDFKCNEVKFHINTENDMYKKFMGSFSMDGLSGFQMVIKHKED